MEGPKAVASAVFAAMEATDLDALGQLAADDRFLEAATRFATRFTDLRLTPRWLIAEGDLVAAWLDLEAMVNTEPIRASAMYALRVIDGRVVDYWLAQGWPPVALT